MSSHTTVHPVFIKMKDIPDSESNWPSVLEVCLTTERERETGQDTVLGAGSVPDRRERERERERERRGRTQCLVLEVCLTAEREREREREMGQDTVLGAGSVPDC